jgi:type I restriction enzyme, R subunit
MMHRYSETNLEDHLEKRLLSSGYELVHYNLFDRSLCLVPGEFVHFIRESQPKAYERLTRIYGADTDQKLIQKASAEIGKWGLIEFLRKGFKDRGVSFDAVYFKPNSGLNPLHVELYEKNRFSLVRQLHFSTSSEESIDTVICLNGIPIITIELKNKYTSQTVEDAKKQYNSRNHKEVIFQFKRCLAHFCVDNDQVFMSTRLSSCHWLPYNKDIVNPINEDGHRTHYFWDEILQKDSVLDIIENFVMLVEETDVLYDAEKGRVIEKKHPILIVPRYHQLDVIRKIRNAVKKDGVARHFLIQHTTGAGKSYEIGWLAHILSSLYQEAEDENRLFDSIVVLTDRRVLDKQLQKTIASLAQVPGVVHPVERTSRQLKEYLEKGKSIIISTIQKFPMISESIAELTDRNFAIIIDEVHSSQSGETAKHVKKALSKGTFDIDLQEDEEYDDFDSRLMQEIAARGRQPNISYFGFTGTPKGKTLELFGEKKVEVRANGEKITTFHPFHTYTMKQSIFERNTFDVLEHYTTYKRYFKLYKKIEEDKEVPKSRVQRQLVNYVDIQPHTIREKIKIILDHFTTQTAQKIAGKARAMVVTRSRLHCVKYMLEMRKQMKERRLPYTCLCAFSASIKNPDDGQEYTENSLNGLSKNVSIPHGFKNPNYRIMIVANKFQTGFDEPMLHTMFVDKKLSGLQCVQTLSRLNRRMSGKNETFVLDFVNEWEEVQAAFQPYYQATYLEGETEPNRLYDLEREIKNYHLFTEYEIDSFVKTFYDTDQDNEAGLPIIEKVVDRFEGLSAEDQKSIFKSKIQSYLRLYAYIMQIADFKDLDLEKLFIFLKFLNKALPKDARQDITDILNAVDLDSFRIEKTWEGKIDLVDTPGGVEGLSIGEASGKKEEEKDYLSEIINVLNDTFGQDMKEEHKVHLKNVHQRLIESDEVRKSMMGNNTEEGKRYVFDQEFGKVSLDYVNDHFDFYKAVNEGPQKNFVMDLLYRIVKDYYEKSGKEKPYPFGSQEWENRAAEP